MMNYLAKASEAGFDVLSEMGSDQVFSHYRKDPRILLIVKNAQELRGKGTAIAQSSGPAPPLPAETKQ
jgi:hypothetical protein